MMYRRGERGEGSFGCIVWAVVLLVAVIVAWKAVPVKIRSAELYDYMLDQAKFIGNKPPADIKRKILRRAKELDLPLDAKNLSVERIGERVRVKASYTVTLEFPGYEYDWEFRHEIDRPIFYF